MDTMHDDRPDLAGEDAGEDADGIEHESIEGGHAPTHSIQDPFDPTTISIDTKFPVVHLIIKRIAELEIDLNPDFQRNPGIWDTTRQSRLIESLLLRIPIPVFYMAADRGRQVAGRRWPTEIGHAQELHSRQYASTPWFGIPETVRRFVLPQAAQSHAAPHR